MKNLYYLFIASLFILFVSCKKDKHMNNEGHSIVGQWIISTEKVEEYNKDTKLREYTNTNVGKVSFRSDGTFTATGPNRETISLMRRLKHFPLNMNTKLSLPHLQFWN